jgi:hypothetical protein
MIWLIAFRSAFLLTNSRASCCARPRRTCQLSRTQAHLRRVMPARVVVVHAGTPPKHSCLFKAAFPNLLP